MQHKHHLPARAMSLLSVAILLTSSMPFLANVAEAGTQYAAEDWELGSTGWTYTTDRPVAGTDCTGQYAYRGLCSLEINAQVNGQVSSASKNLSLSLEPPGYVISYYFRADWPYVRSAGEFKAQLGGTSVKVNHSYAHGNQVALFTNTAGTGSLMTPSGEEWSYAHQTWYRILLKADLVNNKLRIEARATNGTLLATGPALALTSADSVGLVSFEGRYSGRSLITEAPQKINYDWLTVTAPDAPTAPQLLTAIPGPGLGEITVSWQKPSDDGGVPVLHYNVYRGDTADNVTTLIGTTTTRSFTDTGMQNGETHYYAASAVNAAGEGALSNVFVATTFDVPTAPRNLVASPGTTTGDIRLTWQAPTNTGGATISNYRIFRGEESGATTLLAEVAGNVFSYTDAHLPNGSRWYYNVTAINFVGEGPSSNEASALPKPDAATAATNMVLKPDPWWTEQARQLNFTYSVAASQCAPTETCPVTHEWRVYQDGSLTGADGVLLASGTNTHSGHAETTTYNVGTTVTPTGLDGSHALKVVVNAREGSTQWRLASLSFQNGVIGPDPACNANPGFYTYVMPDVATPNQTGWTYAKTYGYKLNGTLSAHRATFVDGCPANGAAGPGDGFYEIGYGGLLLDSSAAGTMFQLPDSTGNPPTFVIGTDVDGSGIIGDSNLDCFQGPYVFIANITCAVDATGHIVLLLVPSEADDELTDNPLWGRGVPCVPVIRRCSMIWVGEPESGQGEGGRSTGYERDNGKDKMGDAWQSKVNATKRDLMDLLDGFQDQEFSEACLADLEDCRIKIPSGDNLTNVNEFRWRTWPLGPLRVCPLFQDCIDLFPNARDYDDDNWKDGPEHKYWNNPSNDPLVADDAWTMIAAAPFDPDFDQNFDTDNLTTLHDPDSDNDGLEDGDEFNTWQTYPEFPDSDCVLDRPCPTPDKVGSEPFVGTHMGAASDPGQPGKGDNITDTNESAAWATIGPDAWKTDYDHDGIATNLLDPDSDGDGLLDGLEFNLSVGGLCVEPCTNVSKFDTDGDGLLDGTNLWIADEDVRARLFIAANIARDRSGAGYTFYGEVTAKTDPLNPDSDVGGGDDLPDGWEVKYGSGALVSNAHIDMDRDGSVNIIEYSFNCGASPCPVTPAYWGGTNPTMPDTDKDGLLDGEEDWNHNAVRDAAEPSPLEPDSDLDGLTDGQEVKTHGTSPIDMDSDDDRLTDYQELVTYARYQVSPKNANTDEWQNPDQNDTLSDYEEIIQYGTDPNDWDSDNDGAADGRDERPLTYDSPPQPAVPSAVRELRITQDIYVAFRSNGYADVILQEPKDQEGKVESVTVYFNFTGEVQGAIRNETSVQEASRLDNGVWGVRVGLPDEMDSSTSQDFSVGVGTSDGNVGYYQGKLSEEWMSRVRWTAEQDPVNGNDWLYLRSNFSREEAPTGAGASMNTAAIPNPFNMTVDELFATYGHFTLFRLKSTAVLAEDASLVRNLTSVSIATPLNTTLEAPNGTLETSAFNVTIYEDAFERVDPLQELGPYQANAGGGNTAFRTPRTIFTGVLLGAPAAHLCDFVKYDWCWSAVFTSKDPRANGDQWGDAVAGMLVFGDVNNVRVGLRTDDPWQVLFGVMGLALTFAPPAKVALVGLRAEVAALKQTDNALAQEIANRQARAIAAGDNSVETILREGHIADFANANPHLRPALKVLIGEVDEATVRALGPTALDNVVTLTDDLTRVYGEATARAIIKRSAEPSVMYPNGGAAAMAELGEVTKVVRDNALGDPTHLDTAAKLMYDLDTIRNVKGKNVHDWWHKRAKNHIKAPDNSGWFGYVFEAEQAARLERDKVLVWLDDTLDDVVVGTNPERDVQVDMYRLTDGSKKILTDAKTAKDGKVRATSDNKAQMEAQAAGIIQWESAKNLRRELHWVVNGDVTDPLRQHALDIYGNYNVLVRFFDRQGNEITKYVPE